MEGQGRCFFIFHVLFFDPNVIEIPDPSLYYFLVAEVIT